MNDSSALSLVQEGRVTLAHAWMIRAFLRHCDEAEDFPELGEFGRAIFDLCRAVDVHVDNPPMFFKTVNKKLGAFRRAVDKFAEQSPRISSHTNFVQAVEAAQGCVRALEKLLQDANSLGQSAIPPQPELQRPTQGET